MQPLLYLVHRIPYPPDKGDKIRSFHLLKYLAKKYDVYLGAFVDDDDDWKYIKDLKEICKDVHLQPLVPAFSTVKSMSGFFTNKALTLPYYANRSMQCWVDETVTKQKISKIVVYSSAMAQYVDGEKYRDSNRVIDFVDVDSDKWRQYSKSKSWPMSWLYGRESIRLLDYEQHIARSFAATFFVSEVEAEHFNKLANNTINNIDYFHNGVDTDYFSPAHNFENPFHENEKPFVFTGAMDYWANVDAVCWFATQVFPKIYAKERNARFYIVGSRPAKTVQLLAEKEGIVVTGRVPDVRPFLAFCCCAVAPMRIARGVQNKVLEAMAMECRVLLTSSGAEGISANSESEWIIADSASEMQTEAINLLDSQAYNDIAVKARIFVKANYNWDTNLSRIDRVLEK